MKNLGKEVLFIKTDENVTRAGESSFIRLKDGILFVYTEYISEINDDHGTAQICGIISYDEGETWSEKKIIIEKDEAAQNVMSPSLFAMSDGRLGMVYLRKTADGDRISCVPVFVYSSDDGKTWSDFEFCIGEVGYYCAINDGAYVTENGRIYIPMSYHGVVYDLKKGFIKGENDCKSAVIRVMYSDDCGKSWVLSDCELKSPFDDDCGFGEPGIMELEDGALWMWFRSQYGYQYQSYSYDGGKTWTNPAPNFHFTSPDSPMRIKKFEKYVVSVFNPVPFNVTLPMEKWGVGKRTPLACAYTEDKKRPFNSSEMRLDKWKLKEFTDKLFTVESNPENSYCYPSLIEVEGGFLVAYYHSNGSEYCLNCTCMKKVLYSEF